MSCNCASGSARGFQQLDASVLEERRTYAAKNAPADMVTSKIWLLEGQACPAIGTADGRKGCVTVPFMGIPVKICWEILALDVTPIVVNVKVKLTVSVAGAEFYSVVLVFKCDNIANPATCSVTAENDLASVSAFSPSCNWGCLRQCAPQCIACGTDYWCWAACAAGCIIRCCHL